MTVLVRRLMILGLVALTSLSLGQDAAPEALLAAPVEWKARYNAGDVDGLAELYTADAVVLPPGAPPVEGRDGLIAVVRGYLDAGAVTIDDPLEEAFVTGKGVAWGRGSFELYAEDGTSVGAGTYLIVYRLIDGRWLIHRHMWNSDLPPVDDGGS
jgi:ketosteroid isomerase-like protein